jgi:hypothetical protein
LNKQYRGAAWYLNSGMEIIIIISVFIKIIHRLKQQPIGHLRNSMMRLKYKTEDKTCENKHKRLFQKANTKEDTLHNIKRGKYKIRG